MPMTNEMRHVIEGMTPRFTLQPMIPVDKDFLRLIQSIAVHNENALPVWAEHFQRREEEEAVYFDEREWRSLAPMPAPHRMDLYTILRGLVKVFEPKHDITIAMRQTVLKALFEQKAKTSVLQLQPQVVSRIVQLSIFDQVIW